MNTYTRRRPLVRVLAPVAALGLLTACAGGSEAGKGPAAQEQEAQSAVAAVPADKLKGTTVQLARVFGECDATTKGVTDVAKAKNECETIQILTNAFNKNNDKGIQVERVGGAKSDTYYDSLNAALASGNVADVALVHASRLTNYARRNLLLPLDKELEVTGTDISDAAPAAREGVTYEGQTYGVPFDIHAGLVHLNVDLFEKAGLVDAQGKPQLPTSPEEFLADAKQMKDRTGVDYFGAGRVNETFGLHLWRSLVQQQGADVLNAERTSATVDTPQARTALEFMDEVFEGGYAEPAQTYDAAQAAFLSGKTAMLLNGTSVVDQYDKEATFDYRAADFPTLYEQPAMWGDSHIWALPRQKDDDPVKYRAALEFVNYLYDHSGDWAIHTGHLAARTSVLESPQYQKAPQRANYVRTGTEIAKQVPKVNNWAAVQDALQAQIDSVWFQKSPVDKALSEANKRVDAALKQ